MPEKKQYPYTRGDYQNFYKAHKQLILDIITTRQKKAIASLMSKLLVLLRDLLMKFNKPRATVEHY